MVNWDDLKIDPNREKIYVIDGEAHRLAKNLSENETGTSQLRNILTAMEAIARRIKDDASARLEIQRLYPLLANARAKKGSGKESKPITDKFYEYFVKELGTIKTKKGFGEFLEFYKAVIQFHAYEERLRKEKSEKGERVGAPHYQNYRR